jgi:hypothetical protein
MYQYILCMFYVSAKTKYEKQNHEEFLIIKRNATFTVFIFLLFPRQYMKRTCHAHPSAYGKDEREEMKV